MPFERLTESVFPSFFAMMGSSGLRNVGVLVKKWGNFGPFNFRRGSGFIVTNEGRRMSFSF